MPAKVPDVAEKEKRQHDQIPHTGDTEVKSHPPFEAQTPSYEELRGELSFAAAHCMQV